MPPAFIRKPGDVTPAAGACDAIKEIVKKSSKNLGPTFDVEYDKG